jgi:hypothetical protein
MFLSTNRKNSTEEIPKRQQQPMYKYNTYRHFYELACSISVLLFDLLFFADLFGSFFEELWIGVAYTSKNTLPLLLVKVEIHWYDI